VLAVTARPPRSPRGATDHRGRGPTSARRARYAALGVPDARRRLSPSFWADGDQRRAVGRDRAAPPPARPASASCCGSRKPVRAGRHPGPSGLRLVGRPRIRCLTDFLGMPIMDGEEILGELFLAQLGPPAGFHRRRTRSCSGCWPRTAADRAGSTPVCTSASRELSILEERHRIARGAARLGDPRKLFQPAADRGTPPQSMLGPGRRAVPAPSWTRLRQLGGRGDRRSCGAIMVGLPPGPTCTATALATALRKQAEPARPGRTARRCASAGSAPARLTDDRGGGGLPGGPRRRCTNAPAPTARPGHRRHRTVHLGHLGGAGGPRRRSGASIRNGRAGGRPGAGSAWASMRDPGDGPVGRPG